MAEQPSIQRTETAAAGAARGLHAAWRGQLWLLVRAMRPRQWAKNLLIFLAFFFTLDGHGADGLTGEFRLFGEVTLGFLIFSVLSGATYVLNDYIDLDADRLHPRKRARPLASGALSPAFALRGAVLAAAAALALAFVLDLGFGGIAAVYLGLIMAYNLGLKHLVILDIMAVAGDFVLRAAAGAQIIDVPISPWLYVMTSLGALLISLGKRRTELVHLGGEGPKHRPVLDEYNLPFIDQLIGLVAPATLVAYTLYTFTAENLPDDNSMMLTIPFVLYGVSRYLYVINRSDMGGSPEEIFLRDRPMLACIFLWLATASGILLYAR